MYFAHVVNTGECHFVLDSDAWWQSLWLEESITFDEFHQLLDT
jgi:hypothetical protein